MPAILIDQDIRPREHLLEQIPSEISTTVGVSGDVESLIAALRDHDVLLATSRLPVTEQVLEQASPRAVGKLGTGIDNIDLDTALNLGIPVTYTPGINALSVAEHTLGLALAALRRAAHCQDVLRRGGWRDETTIGTQLSGQTVGIIGFGDIGERFASLLGGFDVEILANDPYIQPEDTEITGVELVDREIILSEADLVSVNTELTDETRGMLGRKEFQRIKSTAALVNTARGAVLQEAELVEALKKGEIAAAGLDVFTDEPLDASSSLHELENVVLTPHVGARTKQASTACIDRLIDNVFRLLSGNPVPDRYLAVQPVQSSSEV